MINMQDYKNKKKLKRLDEIQSRREDILHEIDKDAIRRKNGVNEKLDTDNYLDKMAELIEMYNELKGMAKQKKKGEPFLISFSSYLHGIHGICYSNRINEC